MVYFILTYVAWCNKTCGLMKQVLFKGGKHCTVLYWIELIHNCIIYSPNNLISTIYFTILKIKRDLFEWKVFNMQDWQTADPGSSPDSHASLDLRKILFCLKFKDGVVSEPSAQCLSPALRPLRHKAGCCTARSDIVATVLKQCCLCTFHLYVKCLCICNLSFALIVNIWSLS